MILAQQDTLASRLKTARLKAGFASAAAACEQYGWALSKYRAHENGQNPFKVKDAEIYAKAYGVSSAWLLTGTGASSNISHNNYILPVAKSPHNIQHKGGDIPLIAICCVGIWREGFLSEGADLEDGSDRLAPIDPRFKSEDQFDIKIQGNAFNKHASDGSYLRCINISNLNADIKDGDFVVIQRHKDNLSEVSAKKVRKNGNGIELINETDDPRLKDQVILLDYEKDDITIIGKVIWTYRNLENK